MAGYLKISIIYVSIQLLRAYRTICDLCDFEKFKSKKKLIYAHLYAPLRTIYARIPVVFPVYNLCKLPESLKILLRM